MGKKEHSCAPSMAKYSCKVCSCHPRGCDIPRHYKDNTNWKFFAQMKECVGDKALEALKEKADKHTLFIFENKYNQKSLPTWHSHPQWKDSKSETNATEGAGDAGPPKKKPTGIMNFFPKITSKPAEEVDESADEEADEEADENENRSEPPRSRSISPEMSSSSSKIPGLTAHSRDSSLDSGSGEHSPGEDVFQEDSQTKTPSREASPSRKRKSRSKEKRNRRQSSTSFERNRNKRRRQRRQSSPSIERNRNNRSRSNERSPSPSDETLLSESQMDRLAEKIAQRLETIKEEKRLRDEEKQERSEIWEEGTDFFVCKFCSKFSNTPEVPPELAKTKRGGGANFGIIGKVTENGERRTDSNLRFVLKRHTETGLHLWCQNKAEAHENAKKSFDDLNEEVGKNVIRAALKNLRRGLGGADFQADIDFLHLIPGVSKSTKNDSRTAYFELRDDAFEIVTEKIQDLFKSGKITEISCTLDKVTVHHKPFTVLLTFFFYNGTIYCVLNELLLMPADGYDAEGTAKMVAQSLQRTTGLPRSRLASILLHFSFDGVYASREQRVAGGGCLDLAAGVTEELGLEEGWISGTWDFAHSLQIVWKNALADHPLVEELIDLVFTSMDEYRTGRSGMIFRERASEMAHLVLTNKKRQTTRFVRSLVRGLETYLRNLPTLIMVHSEAYEDAVRNHQNTKARDILLTLNKLRDPRNLLLSVGLAQLLESYCEASMKSQHNYRFPTQAWKAVMEKKEEVDKLGEKWVWEEKDLVFANIEAPAKIKRRVMEEGVYKPVLKLKTVFRKGEQLRKMGVLEEDQQVSDLFGDDGEPNVALAGEVSMEVPLAWRAKRAGLNSQNIAEDGRSGCTRFLTSEDVENIELELQELAESITKEWSTRQSQTTLEKATYAALGSKFDWGDDRDVVERSGMEAVVNARHAVTMRGLLNDVLNNFPEAMADKFDVDIMLDGYAGFLKWSTQREAEGMEAHLIYRDWYQKYGEMNESNRVFSKFFQNVQIRTASEAMAETIGSIMNNHLGKGRYLEPANFSKEIYLEFNLGPLFLLEGIVQAIYELRQKEYLYRRKTSGVLSTHFSQLADVEEGSSVKTYRNRQVKTAHLPVDIWKSEPFAPSNK